MSGPDHIPQIVTALLVVLGLILAMAWLARRLLRITPRAVGAVRVLSGVSMGPREKLVLVQVGATQLLLGVAPGRIQTLHVLEEAIAPEALGTGLEARFADHLGRPPGALPGLAGTLARAISGRARRRESASEKEPVR